MFTGIILELGTVQKISRHGTITRIEVGAKTVLKGAAVGGSMAVNGVCLTMTSVRHGRFTADMMPETLLRTTMGTLRTKDRVNLEPPLHFGDALGGHLVTGHVEAVGTVSALKPEGQALRLKVDAPEEFLGWVIPKGSAAIDGVSLTVVSKDRAGFWVSLIPHTLKVTNMSLYAKGTRVNLEADPIGKYVVEGLKRYFGDLKKGGVDARKLRDAGFM